MKTIEKISRSARVYAYFRDNRWASCCQVVKCPTRRNKLPSNARLYGGNRKSNARGLPGGGMIAVGFDSYITFPSSKIGANFATEFASTFQCLNYCKQMFIVQVEINNSMESSWSSGPPRRFVFHWIGYYFGHEHFFINEVQTLKCTQKHNWQVCNDLGTHSVKKWLDIDNNEIIRLPWMCLQKNKITLSYNSSSLITRSSLFNSFRGRPSLWSPPQQQKLGKGLAGAPSGLSVPVYRAP